MDLLEIARRTGTNPRQLRYAIYHTLTPGVNKVGVGRGSVRSFTHFEAFAIALAATLLDAGLKRAVVGSCIRVLSRPMTRKNDFRSIPLYQAFQSQGHAEVLLGDARYYRMRVAAAPGWKQLATQWMGDRFEPAPASYHPVVLITVDVRQMAEALRDG